MNQLTPAEKMNRAAVVLARGLRPFIEENAPTQGVAESWVELLQQQDAVDGRRLEYDLDDPRVTLKILSSYWRMFRTPTTPRQTALARDARGLLNKAAHVPQKVSALDFYDLLGTARRLLQSFDDIDVGCIRELEGFAAGEKASATPGVPGTDPQSVAGKPQPAVLPTDTEGETSDDLVLEPDTVSTDAPSPAWDAQSALSDESVNTVDPAIGLDTVTDAEEPTDVVVEEDPREGDDVRNLVDEARRHLSVSTHGLEHATVTVGAVTVVFFYRASLNFGLVHNSVSPLAGVGLINSDEDGHCDIEGLRATIASLDSEEEAWTVGPQHLAPGEIQMLGAADLVWTLPAQPFVDLDEAMLDSLELTVVAGGRRHRVRRPVRLLAHDEWDATTVPELLAAYVRPRSTAVTEVLDRASEVLRERTGDPSFVGYQSGRDRARDTAAAIFEALAGMNIRYTVPPASFEETGQKIRRSEDVLSTRFGTCLDLTVLFAAALEEAGLNPTITVMPGHALVGVLTDDLKLTSFVEDSPEALSNLHGSTFYVPIETTCLADGKEPDFEGAVDRAMSTVTRPGEVTYVLDVRAAHRRVRPLPVVLREGTTTVIQHESVAPPTTTRARGATARPTEGAQTLEAESFPRRVQGWRNRLLDLTFRNPLLKLSDRRGIELLLSGDDLGTFEDLLASKKSISLTPSEDVAQTIDGLRGYESAKHLPADQRVRLFREEGRVFAHNSAGRTQPRLNRLRRDARTRREETGANSLYIALGLMRWKDGTGRSGRSPMFLLPCRLDGSTRRPFTVSKDPEAEIQPNYCLIEKLRVEHDLKIPELEEPPRDDSGIDLPLIFDKLRELFIRNSLDGFSIEDTAFLAILEFSTLDLWRDISENWLELAQAPVVQHLIESPGENFQDTVDDPDVNVVDEVDVALPMPADGSQLQAIKAASAGRTFVLEGPPGTGKSQTITNMIADGLSRGRKILFVAEKQAALNVVHDRLQQIGLSDLVLNVHGQTQTLNSVRSQLRDALASETNPKATELEELQQRVRDQVNQLAEYPRILHAEDSHESVWESYQRCLSLERDFPVNSAWRAEDIDLAPLDLSRSRSELVGACREVTTAAAQLGPERLPDCLTLVGDAELDAEAWSRALSSARSMADAVEALPRRLADVLSLADETDMDRVSDWIDDLPSGQAVLPRHIGIVIPSEEQLRVAEQKAAQLNDQFDASLPDLSVQVLGADMNTLKADEENLRSAGWFARRKVRKEVGIRLRALTSAEHAEPVAKNPGDLLSTVIRFRGLADALLSDLRHCNVTVSAEDLLAGRAVQIVRSARRFYSQQRLLKEKTELMVRATPRIAELLDTAVSEDPAGAERGDLGAAWEQVRKAWRTFVADVAAGEESLTEWRRSRRLGAALCDDVSEWSALRLDELTCHHLVRQHRHWRALRRLRSMGLASVVDALGDGREVRGLDAAVDLARQRYMLETALARTGLAYLKSEDRRRQVEDYMRLSDRLRKRLRPQIAAAYIGTGGSSRPVSTGLRKETQRRRGGSTRQLFSKYGEEILGLTPCVLMSPSSVARNLPIGEVRFDTVIFDEASQIPVADAVGALGRADAAVIVGDSKQLPPTTMFSRDAAEPEDEDAESEESQDDVLAAADQESILSEAVGSGLEQKLLSWHYRSRDETLISFSNEKYYDGELSVFPSPPVKRPGFGVSSHYVGGTFEGGRGAARVNRAEADAICTRIREMIAGDPSASIGVVTFNSQQRDLILDRLEQDESAAVRDALEREEDAVFVKNLENVQGDERDTILFSLAFSRDPETGVMPLNFGPLNKSGGERRLNVAITRARQAVELYTSFRAVDIDLARTRSEGLHHLREYLAYAEAGGDFTHRNVARDYDLYREQIASELREHGLDVSSDIGSSKFRVDLAVRVSEAHGWLAVLLDTPEWASRRVTADREALPAAVLENVMGWQATEQILLPDWLRAPDAVVERIADRAAHLTARRRVNASSVRDDEPEITAISDSTGNDTSQEKIEIPQDGVGPREEATATSMEGEQNESGEGLTDPPACVPVVADHSGGTSPESSAPPKGSEARAQEKQSSTSGELQVPAPRRYDVAPADTVGAVADLDDIHTSSRVRSLVRQLMHDLVQREGPIEAERAARLVGRRFGLDRVVKDRVKNIQSVASVNEIASKSFGTFYWPTFIDPSGYRDFRPRQDGVGVVEVDEIAPEEIANAMESVLRREGSVQSEELIRETMAIFGYTRLGQRIRTRFSGVLDACVRERRFHREGDDVSVAV